MVHFIFYEPLSIDSHNQSTAIVSHLIPAKLQYVQMDFVDDKSFFIWNFPKEIFPRINPQITLVCHKLEPKKKCNYPRTGFETQIFASIFMYFLVCTAIDFQYTDTIYCQTIIMKQTQANNICTILDPVSSR